MTTQYFVRFVCLIIEKETNLDIAFEKKSLILNIDDQIEDIEDVENIITDILIKEYPLNDYTVSILDIISLIKL